MTFFNKNIIFFQFSIFFILKFLISSFVNFLCENIFDEEFVNAINEVFGLKHYMLRILIRNTKSEYGISKDALIDLKEIFKH